MNIRLSIKQQRIIAIVVVVLACLWFFWFRHYLDKQKFVRIEVGVEELTQRIVSEFGLEVAERRNFCSREARKFETGPLNCYVSTVFKARSINNVEVVNFILNQDNLANDVIGRLRFKLINGDANCIALKDTIEYVHPRLSSYQRNGDLEYLDIQCSKRATTSHFQFIE